MRNRAAARPAQRRPTIAASAALLLACGAFSLAGCAGSSYAGIRLAAGTADPELQELARRASAGDERAQLELGIRYEEGRGLPVDLARARELYFDAATRPSRNRIAMYVPTPGGAVSGFVRLLPAGLEFSGLEEALLRWHRLLPRSGGDGTVSPAPPRAGDMPAARTLQSVPSADRSEGSLAAGPRPAALQGCGLGLPRLFAGEPQPAALRFARRCRAGGDRS